MDCDCLLSDCMIILELLRVFVERICWGLKTVRDYVDELNRGCYRPV